MKIEKYHNNETPYFEKLSHFVGVVTYLNIICTGIAYGFGAYVEIQELTRISRNGWMVLLICVVFASLCLITVMAELIVAYIIQVFCEHTMYLHNISASLEKMEPNGESGYKGCANELDRSISLDEQISDDQHVD